MQKCLSFLALSAFVVTVPSFGKAIYGKDNRVEVYEATKAQQLNARSAATMISKLSISSFNRKGLVKIQQTSLKQYLEKDLNLPGTLLGRLLNKNKEKISFCEGERFVEQPSAGTCSGFLIAPDLIMTAGHCMDSQSMCREYKWVFDYQVDEETKEAGIDIPSESVYSCKKIISSSLMDPLGVDFGIIQLDRKVTGRMPVKLRREGSVRLNDPLYVVGSPSGLPLKVADGAKVELNDHPFYFYANLDAFEGNSGSAVFNDITGEVEGILVSGEKDYKQNKSKNCIEAFRCKEGECEGEKVYSVEGLPEVMVFNTLEEAIHLGDLETVKAAIRTNFWIDFNLQDGESALIKAVKAQRSDMVRLLLSAGANKNHTDGKGKRAFDYALEKSDQELIALLKY